MLRVHFAEILFPTISPIMTLCIKAVFFAFQRQISASEPISQSTALVATGNRHFQVTLKLNYTDNQIISMYEAKSTSNYTEMSQTIPKSHRSFSFFQTPQLSKGGGGGLKNLGRKRLPRVFGIPYIYID